MISYHSSGVIQDPENWPVFIHCWKGNDRVGFYVAAYRIVGRSVEFRTTQSAKWSRSTTARCGFEFPHVLRGIDVEKVAGSNSGAIDRIPAAEKPLESSEYCVFRGNARRPPAKDGEPIESRVAVGFPIFVPISGVL